MKLPFDPIELTQMASNGMLGVTGDMKERIADTLASNGTTRFTEDDLFDASWNNGVDPGCLRLDDIRDIRHLLEEKLEEE